MTSYEEQVNNTAMEMCNVKNQKNSKDLSKCKFSKHKQIEVNSFSKSFAAIDISKNACSEPDICKNNLSVNCSNFVDEESDQSCTNTVAVSLQTTSTPTLIVSDTSTGINNFIIEPNLPPSHPVERMRTAAKPINCNSICKTDDTNIWRNKTLIQNTNSDTGIETDSDSTLFLPLKVPVCDSAYGSSMESRSDTLSPSIYCGSEISRHNSENETSTEPSSEHCDSLSVCFPPSLFSSTSSITSDSIGENETHESELLQVEPEHRKLSSSSSISIR